MAADAVTDQLWYLAAAAVDNVPPEPKTVQEAWSVSELWFACQHPERPFDEDTALHDCCRACLLAAQVAVARGYAWQADGDVPLLDSLAARLEQFGEAAT